jgi:hypothetical protein
VHIEISAGQVTAALSAVAGAVTAASVLWLKVIKPMRVFMSRAETFWSDWSGVADRPGVPGRPGMMVRMASNEAAVAEIRHEVQTNNGGSLRDAVNGTQAAVVELRRQMDVATLIMPQRPAQRPDGPSEIESAVSSV